MPAKARPRPIGQVMRRRVESQHLFDLVEQVEGVTRLAIELVDEGDDGDVAEPADFEQLPGARFDTACAASITITAESTADSVR